MTKEAEYKKIYLQESDELLQQMNQSLLLLEKEPASTDALNAIFRSAHTLKSMSASMGYTPIAGLSHKMEDLLSQLRDDIVEMNPRIIDILFKSFDVLDEMVSFVQSDKAIDTDITSIVADLDSVMKQRRVFEEETSSSGISLNEFEKKAIIRVKVDGLQCYHVKITLEKSCVLKSVRAFMVYRNLHSIGEVIKSYPDSQALSEEKFELDFSCIFVTKDTKEAVRANVMDILEVEGVSVDDIDIDEIDTVIDKKGTGIEAVGVGRSEPVRRINSVRVNIERLDKMMNLVEELAIAKLHLNEVGLRVSDADLKNVIETLSRLTEDLQTEVMQARLVPVGQIFDRFPRMVRDLAKKTGKKIKFDVLGSDIELDRTVLDEIGDPLIHLLRNAIDHGIESPEERSRTGKPETGRVMLSAVREKNHVVIDVEDDGRGMDVAKIGTHALEKQIITSAQLSLMTEQDILLLTALPGFSTTENVTDVSGRGVGLDVVKQKAESLGGSMSIETKPNVGTKIVMRLPMTMAVVQALLVTSMGKVFTVPISSVVEIIVIADEDIKKVENAETIIHREKVVPIIRLADHFRGHKSEELLERTGRLNILILENGKKQFGIVVDKFLSQQDIVIKQLTKELKSISGFAGATILGDGSVALVLDVATLI